MAIIDDINADIDSIASSTWDIKEGRTVPETEDIGLGNVGTNLDATMFYADLADSTTLVSYDKELAAEVFKAFLAWATRLIRHRGGYIRSFDGDRVMGVFINDIDGFKNTRAVKTALNLKYAFRELLVPRFKEQYAVFKNDSLDLSYCAGVDTGKVLVARGGVWRNNDLVWVGPSANVAAKLSTRRVPPYNTYITKAVYDAMKDDVKVSSSGENMWVSRTWDELPVDKQTIYKSSWYWKP